MVYLKAEQLSVTVVGVSGPALRAFHKTAQDVNIEAFDRPLVKHYEAKNPYKSRYGAAMWESKVRAELRTAGICVYITELVEHMITQSAAVMKGTAHEDDWVFYHDNPDADDGPSMYFLDEGEGLFQEVGIVPQGSKCWHSL